MAEFFAVISPCRTPAMIGCSFVVDREYFGEIGLLDPGMEVYGGENIELGMRVSNNKETLCSVHVQSLGSLWPSRVAVWLTGHYAAVIDAVTISGGGRICFFGFSCQCLKPMRKDFPFPSAFPRANSLSNSPCAHCPRLRLYICALTDAIPTENKGQAGRSHL